MKRPLLFLTWATVFTVPCWLISNWYQNQVLAPLVRVLASLLGHSLRIHDLEVFAPFEIGCFVAMCLSSGFGRRAVTKMVALGILLLVAMEIAILLVASVPAFLPASGKARLILGDLAHYLVKTIVWANPVIAWVLLGSVREDAIDPDNPRFGQRSHRGLVTSRELLGIREGAQKLRLYKRKLPQCRKS